MEKKPPTGALKRAREEIEENEAWIKKARGVLGALVKPGGKLSAKKKTEIEQLLAEGQAEAD